MDDDSVPQSRKVREKSSRSRSGCERCRRRRQKCDQQKPCCKRCVNANAQCRYELKLSWGGRSFRKSAFGQCLENIETIDIGTPGDGFIYCLPQTNPIRNGEPRQEIESLPNFEMGHDLGNHRVDIIAAPAPDSQDLDNITTLTPLKPLTAILPPLARYLLEFYISQTMRLTVPSTFAHTEICRFLVPMSLQQPCLLYAMMTFAAVHLEAIGKLSDNAKELIHTLQTNSISHLRHRLTELDPISRAVCLATTRTLCQVQIHGGKSLWRVHLKGARAIFESTYSIGQSRDVRSRTFATEEFLSSWYNNAEALAALTPHGIVGGQLETVCTFRNEVFFDVFGGVMSDLPDLFREVGALVKEKHRAESDRLGAVLSENDIEVEAERLRLEIQHRLQRDTAENLHLSPQIRATLSRNDIHDYALSNAAFLYTALLHIYCGIQMRSPLSNDAQFCVDRIIWCADNMTCLSGLSPRVLLVAPLFTAGLCAAGVGRVSIRSALTDIGTWMKTPHLIKTLELLDSIWAQSVDTNTFGAWAWSDRINLDFLPY